jgi:hypothetical protein
MYALLFRKLERTLREEGGGEAFHLTGGGCGVSAEASAFGDLQSREEENPSALPRPAPF